MTQIRKHFGTAMLAAALLAVLPACQKQEGPAESAGKEIDKAVSKAGQEVEKAGEKIQDAAQRERR